MQNAGDRFPPVAFDSLHSSPEWTAHLSNPGMGEPDPLS